MATFLRAIIPPEWIGYSLVSYRILWLENGHIEYIELDRTNKRYDFFVREGLKALANAGMIDSTISMQYYKPNQARTIEKVKKI